jgi:hypothetical protein
VGNNNFFEWTIQTSAATLNAALAAGSFKTNDSFNNALVAYFSMRLNSLYQNQISNITLVSFNTLPNQQYALTFRLYFLNAISNSSLRTNILSNIQTIYFGILKSYFTTISKSITMPTSVTINVPPPINTTTKAIVVMNQTNAIQTLASAVQLIATNLSPSILSATGTGSSMNYIYLPFFLSSCAFDNT